MQNKVQPCHAEQAQYWTRDITHQSAHRFFCKLIISALSFMVFSWSLDNPIISLAAFQALVGLSGVYSLEYICFHVVFFFLFAIFLYG